MGTLLKWYRPLPSIRFFPPPSSLLPSIQFPPRSSRIFSISKRRIFLRLCSITSSPSSINDKVNAGDGAAKPLPELWLHNTMGRKKELFKPKVEGKVGMYVCGVTAYDLSHIGHARVYVTFDVLYRYLRHLGYEVYYVRNFTDVDDKIINRANELGEDPISLSRRYCEEFHHDMIYLHCLPPSVEPRVSDHMPQIIDMIKQILDNGCAYRIDGDVYFSVDNFPEYGQLSGRKLEDNRAGERVAVNSRKKNPADFALWKSAKEGEPFWESPWGPGRPGWHIECSAMSAAYLGHAFDIHGGGMDLVFPHHENEIAQSCAACRDSNITYWIHNGFVTIDSEKMSKSLGNFFTIRQVIDLYHPLALRLFLLGTHYRSPINYSDMQLESASERIFYIYQTLHDCETVISQHNMEFEKDSVPSDTLNAINQFHDVFVTSMSDDLHTPVLLAALSDPLKIMNDMLHTRKGKKQTKRIESLAALEKAVRNALSVLGLMPTAYSEALQQLREKALKRAKLTEDQVLQKIEERNVARKNKDYEKSDTIRKDLAALGIALMDSPDATNWRPAIPLALQEQQITAP
ncbi:cysteine--tRNA ligase, chloroplastic/mitochondrial isoform X1 [Euphorbia lathyris]|uniref:cysteine--tRNA ligase, chloroplastic/mitochondrial isoform X1 n=2 Tax=Euphorbia lathyris TaxID=212925 RepID=UPI0033138E3F